ncbi:MAG: right-handed parallel beta-helix repeat-containing protein [Tetrasphaera sp.]
MTRDPTGATRSLGKAATAAEPAIPAGAESVHVGDVAALGSALASATPGTIIDLADGVYTRDGGDRFIAAADGTAKQPITLRGGRGAVLTSDDAKGDYGLHVTGDHWQLIGFSVRDATKGIVLDGSVGTIISGVDVGQVGEEGVHFRMCSSNGVLRDSTIHDTGLVKRRFGEGVYVGSASSNWGKYACDGEMDDTEGVVIQGNTFLHIPAEGADIKEGTDSGTIRDNVFDDTGYAGENSADSAIDVKGNGWVVVENTITNPSGEALDAIQTHQVAEGYGMRNTFVDNVIEGNWPGFGLGLYPLGDNVVACSNTAADAELGLVGDNSTPTRCS